MGDPSEIPVDMQADFYWRLAQGFRRFGRDAMSADTFARMQEIAREYGLNQYRFEVLDDIPPVEPAVAGMSKELRDALAQRLRERREQALTATGEQ